ncbi:hypothetical protein U1Q18_002035, partial [Sarracenia purpurea var. burkii]
IGEDDIGQIARADPNATDPVGVGVNILNGVFALSLGVLELYATVLGGEGEPVIVNREGDGMDILGAADEATGN